MSADRQTMLLHAVPLLILAGLYGLVSILLGLSLLRERRASGSGSGSGSSSPSSRRSRRCSAGWRSPGTTPLPTSPPGSSSPARSRSPSPGHRARPRPRSRAARHRPPARARGRGDRHRAWARGRRHLAALVRALRRADSEDAAAALFDEVDALLAAGRAPARPRRRGADGLRRPRGARRRRDVVAGRRARPRRGPGAIVSVVRDRTPLSIYDAVTPTNVNRALADAVGRRAPPSSRCSPEGDVGVLVAVTQTSRRTSRAPSSTLVQGLAARRRSRSAERARTRRCGPPLERERLIAEIGRRVRSELDLDTVLRVAVEETARRSASLAASSGSARSVSRCRSWPSGTRPGSSRSRTSRRTPGTEPRGARPADRGRRRRRDVRRDRRPELARRQAASSTSDRARRSPRPSSSSTASSASSASTGPRPRWLPGEIALAEAVARELGLAIHTARLLGENEQRLRRQETLIEAAQVLTSDLRFESVIRRLVEEVVALTGADAADCWILEPDRTLLRCRAVVGVPEWNVGRQIPPEGTIGRALQSGDVLTHDFAARSSRRRARRTRSSATSCRPRSPGSARRAASSGVCSREPGRFDESDIEVVEAFARFASLALHNAESFEERERQARFSEASTGSREVLGSTLSRAETLDALAQAACDALGGDAASCSSCREMPRSWPERTSCPPAFGRRSRPPRRGLWPFSAPTRRRRSSPRPSSPPTSASSAALRAPLVAAGYGSLLCAPVAGVRTRPTPSSSSSAGRGRSPTRTSCSPST